MGITIQQLSVFLENREGRLDEVLSVLAGNDVNIVALSLAQRISDLEREIKQREQSLF